MNLFDVHAHLDLVPEKEIQELISRAEQKNVRTIITNSTSSETGKKSLELQEKHRTVRAALGIYPANAAGLSEKQLQEEISFIEKNRKINNRNRRNRPGLSGNRRQKKPAESLRTAAGPCRNPGPARVSSLKKSGKRNCRNTDKKKNSPKQ